MPLNRTDTDKVFDDRSLPIWKDLFFSLLLHVLIFALISTFALWNKQQRVEPLMRIEVTMISNKQLATLQQLAHPVSRAKSRSVQATLEPVEAKSIHTPQVAPKPVTKPKHVAMPIPELESAPHSTVKPQAAAEMESVLKPEVLSEPVISPAAAPEPIINPKQASEPVVKFERAMKPVVSFKPASRPVIRLNTPAKPVLKLKAEAEPVIDMEELSEPVADMKPRPAPVIDVSSAPAPSHSFKPAAVSQPELTPKPAVIAKPVLKLKPPPVIKSEPDPDYDPFAPMESAGHQQRRSRTMKSAVRELTGDTKKQLSRKEINRYIKGMQQAVEKHWKIAVTVEHVKDPLVEMVLLPGGRIKSLRILESSGNATVNASLIRAIHAAAPFELPKQQFEYFRVNRIRFHPFK